MRTKTKMTHGFPALDGPTTADNYAAQVKASSDNSISNLKNEAEELHFRVKYFGDDTAQAFEDLRRSIEDLRDESEMHDDCATRDELDNALDPCRDAVDCIQSLLDILEGTGESKPGGDNGVILEARRVLRNLKNKLPEY